MDNKFEGKYEAIPDHMREAMLRWVEHGIQPGSFLCAVIRNNLHDAIVLADEGNLPLLSTYVDWFYWVAPSGSFGSDAALKSWKGMNSPRPKKT